MGSEMCIRDSSDTAGQAEAAADTKGAVRLFMKESADSLRKELQSLLDPRDSLQKSKRSAWEAYPEMSWEKEKKKLPPFILA